jgi:hypothetical protein
LISSSIGVPLAGEIAKSIPGSGIWDILYLFIREGIREKT